MSRLSEVECPICKARLRAPWTEGDYHTWDCFECGLEVRNNVTIAGEELIAFSKTLPDPKAFLKAMDCNVPNDVDNGVGCRLGRWVRQKRQAMGMTLPELAKASGVSKGTLSKLENGGVNLTIETLTKLSLALKTPAMEMFNIAMGKEGK